MGVIAVTGNVCTTTAVALASAWPASDDVVQVESDVDATTEQRVGD